MADAYWMQLGTHPTFAFEVDGKIVGVAYWLDAEGLEDVELADGAELPESGWYFVAVNLPRHPERGARGLELRRDMTQEELAHTAERALEVVANEVLAEGDDE